MFYKVLFLLTCYNLYRSIRSFVRENAVVKDGKVAEISVGAYISAGMTVLFYVMVLAICSIPSILFWKEYMIWNP